MPSPDRVGLRGDANPEPPVCIAEAMLACYGARMTDSERAQAVWNALLIHGERWQRIGQVFYDDTDEGTPVLVIPLEAGAGRGFDPTSTR